MKRGSFRRVAVAAVLLGAFFLQGTWALAGTTGGVAGTVTDQSGKPIAGAHLTATAPSQTASTTTDSSGHFTLLSLAPDTYTLQVEKEGFANQSVTGVVIFADNTQTLAITLQPQLKTIANVTSRSASSVVKAGTTTDVYSVNAAVANQAQALGGGGSLNQAYSALASTPGVFIPQGQSGWAQSVYIRGSNYTQLGYEFDGVPIQRSFDQYPAGTVSSLGQQELQVYAGAAPSDAQSSAIGGFINQVIKTGTFPGFGNGYAGYGTPSFYRKLTGEAGGSQPNRLFSYYVGIGSYNQAYRYIDQYNGAYADQTLQPTPYSQIAENCNTAFATSGCFQNTAGYFKVFPTNAGNYAAGPVESGSALTSALFDRDWVVNLHFAIPHHRDGGRDDVQALYSNTFLRTQFPTAFNDWNYAVPNVTNGTATINGVNVPGCTGAAPTIWTGTTCAAQGPDLYRYFDTTNYIGPVGVQLTPALLGDTNNYLQPNSPQVNRSYFQQTPLSERDFYSNNFTVTKLQYQHNMGSTAFVRIYGYLSYSDWLQNSLSGATLFCNYCGAVSPDYELITHTAGGALSFVDQLTPQHLLNFTAGYTQATTTRWNNQWYNFALQGEPIAVAVNSANPTNGLCYTVASPGAAGTPSYCGAATSYSPPAAPAGQPVAYPGPLVAPNVKGVPTGVNVNNIGASTCGGGPCEFYTVQSGQQGAFNTVKPQFDNLSINDTFRPNDHITFDAGLHYDNFGYGLGDGTVAPAFETPGRGARVLWQNSTNLFTCFNPGTLAVTQPAGMAPNGCGALGLQQVAWTNNSPSFQAYQEWEPRFGFTYEINPLNVVRLAYGRFAQPPSSAFQQYLNANYNTFTFPANTFYQFGIHGPSHLVFPEISYNLDGSWEHQAKGSDFSFKISPFYRKTQNEIFNDVLDPKTNFVSGLNVGRKTVTGAELLLSKGDFNRDGLSAQFSYTYTYATVQFNDLPNGRTVLSDVNSSIATYNAFTSFCAGHPTDSRCQLPNGLGHPTDPNSATNAPVVAAPCYTAAGAPSFACAAGSIANPYWNAPVQPLMDNGASYIAYNQLPGTGVNSVASSYVIPHVFSLLTSYKKGRVRVSPSFQLTMGGRYGSPVQGQGIDPQAGCANPYNGGLATLQGSVPGPIAPGKDPRYPYGAPGGQPYNAVGCTGAITTPNFVTGQFDNFGALLEPSTFTANLQVDVDVTPRVSVSMVATNLFFNCFGGTNVPWAAGPRLGCWYTSNPAYGGNFYNPGTAFSVYSYPYYPTISNTFQQAYGGASNPTNFFVTARVKL